MHSSAPAWVDPLMRLGYAARGVVYVLVGALAFMAALEGGSTPDSKRALAKLLEQPLGEVMLLLIAAGLFAYAIWRFVDAALDLDSKGDKPSGWAARAAQVISGTLHLLLGATAASLALRKESGGGDRTEHWTAVLMEQPLGRWLVAAVGCIAIVIGVQQCIKAYREKYKAELRYTDTAERLDPLIKLGLVAHGVVIAMVGAFFIWAAWTADPSRAGGLRDALQAVREAEAGQILFAVMALGLIGFSAYCFIAAAYRIVPRCAPNDLQTLATRARVLMSGAMR